MAHAQHRQNLLARFHPNANTLIYLKGAVTQFRYDTDYEYRFRQESNFWYLTGINEPDFHVLLHPVSGKYHLFTPVRDAKYAVWHGYITSQDDYKAQFAPDAIHIASDLEQVIASYKPDVVYCYNEQQAAQIQAFGVKTEHTTLRDALVDCRVIKTEYEKTLLRRAGKVASEAHVEVAKVLREGMLEHEVKAHYEFHVNRQGAVFLPYAGIYGAGKNSAILHYLGWQSVLKNGEFMLIDAGAEVEGYVADITRTHVVGGKKSALQEAVYQACLTAHQHAIAKAGPGVKMEELHLAAARDILSGLKDADLVKGDVDTLMEKNIFALFFPHGLGHFLGLDTHDVGGYPKGVDRIDRPGIHYLRARRTLEPGMAITIEPGVYFIEALLAPALENADQKPYLNEKLLKTMYDFGGVRIEDNLLITEKGNENFTYVPVF